MAQIRFRPTWAELKAYGALVTIGNQEFIKLKTVEKLLQVISVKTGYAVKIPQGLETIQLWTKEQFEALPIPELKLESASGSGDELDDAIIKVIAQDD